MSIEELRQHLNTLAPGPVEDSSQIATLLASCWDGLAVSDPGGMEAYKLTGRMEEVRWNPPVLTFVIERHGGTVLGSSRGELQYWEVDTERGCAGIVRTGHRQLTPSQPRWHAKPAAAEVAALIRRGAKDERLDWRSENEVRVKVGAIVPGGVQQTVEGRRKRFWQEPGHSRLLRLSPGLPGAPRAAVSGGQKPARSACILLARTGALHPHRVHSIAQQDSQSKRS